MEKKENYTYGVAYKLYAIENGEKTMLEEAPADQPFRFISGLSMALPTFENNIVKLEENDEFDFTLEKEEAYGEHYDERIIDLDKNIFCIEGKFDSNNIYEGAIVPLQNEDGNRFMGQEIGRASCRERV